PLQSAQLFREAPPLHITERGKSERARQPRARLRDLGDFVKAGKLNGVVTDNAIECDVTIIVDAGEGIKEGPSFKRSLIDGTLSLPFRQRMQAENNGKA